MASGKRKSAKPKSTLMKRLGSERTRQNPLAPTGIAPNTLPASIELNRNETPTERDARSVTALRALAKEIGVDPFEIMLHFAGDKAEKLGYDKPVAPELRLAAAKEAAKYLYPQLKSVEVTNGLGQPLSLESKLNVANKIAAMLDKLASAAAGFERPNQVLDGEAKVTDVTPANGAA